MITVAAAIIIEEGKVLIARRSFDLDLWEFPGGRVEGGQSPEACLVRELQEKLGVEVTVGELVCEMVHHYPDNPLLALAYDAKIACGEPALSVDDRIAWVSGDKVFQYRLAPVWTSVAERVAAGLENYYDKWAGDYFDATASIDPTPFLAPIIRYFRPGAKVLDVGSGCGRDLLWLKGEGYTAIGFERSQNLAALARQHSGCPVIVDDFFHYDFSQIRMDAILLTGALVHVPRQRLAEVMGRILRALCPGGLIYLSLKEGVGEKQADDGRTFVLWKEAELLSIFAALHLEILDFSRQVSRLSQDDTWLGYLLRHHNDYSHG